MGIKHDQSVHYEDIRYLCGAFTKHILDIFPSNSDVILTTPAHRRQFWYAVIAKNLNANLPLPSASQLQFMKSECLLELSFGSAPKFMATILKRIGVTPQVNQWYLDLYQVLTENPAIGHELVNIRHLSDVIPALAKFPSHLRNVGFVSKFHARQRAEDFLQKFNVLAGLINLDDPNHYLVSKMNSGCKPDRVLRLMYEDIKFSPAVLQKVDGLKYLGSVKDILDAAQSFNNCLENRIELAHCNAHQHYHLKFDGHEIIFSIQKLADNSWQFYEAEDKDDLFADGPIQEKMNEILQQNNVSISERISMIV